MRSSYEARTSRLCRSVVAVALLYSCVQAMRHAYMLATSNALRDFVTQSWLSLCYTLACKLRGTHLATLSLGRGSRHMLRDKNSAPYKQACGADILFRSACLVACTQKGQPFRSTVLFWRRYFFVTYGV